MKERSLVAFTLLVQWAVGWWLALALFPWVGAAGAAAHWAVVALTTAALLISLFHLGAPANAWRAIANVRSSPLSREVVLALMFFLFTAVYCLIETLLVASTAWLTALSWFNAVVGLWLVWTMAQAYRLRTVPAWNTWVTPASFFSTTLLLGVLALNAMLVWNPAIVAEWPAAALHLPAGCALALLIIEGLLLRRSTLASDHPVALRMRWGLAILGIAVSASAALCAFALVFAAEILGRALFYESRIQRL